MTKQEEIKQIIWGLYIKGITPDEAFAKLKDLGVVIKVKRELPERKWFNDFGGESGKKGYQTCYKDVMDAGYVAVEPLIKEDTWDFTDSLIKPC